MKLPFKKKKKAEQEEENKKEVVAEDLEQVASTEKVEANQESEVVEKPAKKDKKRRSFLGFLKKKEMVEEQVAPKIITKSGTTDVISQEALLERMAASQIAEVEKGEYVTLKIRKQSVLIASGVALVTMWVVPLYQQLAPAVPAPSEILKIATQLLNSAEESTPESSESADLAQEDRESLEASDSAGLKREEMKIRVRIASDKSEILKSLVSLLEEKAYGAVDTVEESSTDIIGIEVIVKPDQENVRKLITADLSDSFEIATSTAELTEDSDFDAVILVGD